MYQICYDDVYSIERVISNDKYILKTNQDGLKILTINDSEAKQFTIQNLLNIKYDIFTEQILEITPSQIVFAKIEN
jgi:hypothetical protein